MNAASVIAAIFCSSRDRSQTLRHDPRRSRKTDDKLVRRNSGGLFGRWGGYGHFPDIQSLHSTTLCCSVSRSHCSPNRDKRVYAPLGRSLECSLQIGGRTASAGFEITPPMNPPN